MDESTRPAIYAPVISATPKNSSALNDSNKHITKDTITNLLLSISYLSTHLLNNLYVIIPTIILNIKNPTIFTITFITLTDEPAKLVIIVKTSIPKTSSIMAAPTIIFPTEVDTFPSSLKVSTVILTDVAVKTEPINIFCTKTLTFSTLPWFIQYAKIVPPIKGIITPITATINEVFPLFLNSLKLLSSPALNNSTITPTSANCLIKSVSCIILNTAGPNIKPANNAPTTCGNLNLFVTNDKSFVLSKISARSNKYRYDIHHYLLYTLSYINFTIY